MLICLGFIAALVTHNQQARYRKAKNQRRKNSSIEKIATVQKPKETDQEVKIRRV